MAQNNDELEKLLADAGILESADQKMYRQAGGGGRKTHIQARKVLGLPPLAPRKKKKRK
jgi:hypothetical protein